MMTRLISNSILKLLVISVGHVKSLGNIMSIGMDSPRQTSPSAIWMFCTSVASLAIPSVHPHVSTLTNWSSIDLILASHDSTINFPLKGSSMAQFIDQSCPLTLNLGTLSLLLTFLNDSGETLKVMGCMSIGSLLGDSTINSTTLSKSFVSIDLLTSHLTVYWMEMKTPWYVSKRVFLPFGFNGSSKGTSVLPAGIFPDLATSTV